MQKIADLRYAAAVLQWDQETYLPPKGIDARGRQIATLSEMAHELATHPALGELLQTLQSSQDLSAAEKRNVQLTWEDFQRHSKLSPGFVRELSEAVTTAYHAWAAAREAADFNRFADPLEKIVRLKQQEASLLGYEQHPYDALMNDYDKGLTVAITDRVFTGLKPALLQLLQYVRERPQVDNSFLHRSFPKDAQWKFGLALLKEIGFDFDAGRQDISLHPFTTSFSSEDVRVTTRIDEQDLGNMAWSCIHEGGHALYEQGLPATQYGLPLGEYCSLSIHESQSRLWENCIGRGQAFWQHHLPLARQSFPGMLDDIDAVAFFKGINRVAPSLIRTEADELTYHFHVMIRYEIEKQLISGQLATREIPDKWNQLYQDYLGVAVPNDRLGCLQDIHWSHGSFGYFATYSLGSLYAAQLYAAIEREIPSLEAEIAAGNTSVVLGWLQENIYRHGRFYSSEALCHRATGEFLNPQYFIDYATKKYTRIYG